MLYVQDPNSTFESQTPTTMLSVEACSGSLNGRINNFSVRCQDQIEGNYTECLRTALIDSGLPGYDFRAHFYAYGDGSFYGRGLTIAVHVSPDRCNDDQTQRRVAFSITVTIEDQSSSSVKNHIKLRKRCKPDNQGACFARFNVSHRRLEDVHLVDDSVAITVEVKPTTD